MFSLLSYLIIDLTLMTLVLVHVIHRDYFQSLTLTLDSIIESQPNSQNLTATPTLLSYFDF